MAKNNELSSVAYRRLIAAIDWVEHLATLMGGLSAEDKVSAFGLPDHFTLSSLSNSV